MTTRRIFVRLAMLAWPLWCMLQAAPGWAQAYPSRTVTLVCPFPPGGSADIMACMVAQKPGERLGAPVVVENKAGAGSAVGSAYVAKARPDGHTLLLITGAYPAQAALTLKPQFDAFNDIAMVSMVTAYPFLVKVANESPYRSAADLVAHARANPGKLNYLTSGVG